MSDWEKLIEACRQFASLHNNPEPGLFTWNSFVNLRYQEIKTLIQLLEDDQP